MADLPSPLHLLHRLKPLKNIIASSDSEWVEPYQATA